MKRYKTDSHIHADTYICENELNYTRVIMFHNGDCNIDTITKALNPHFELTFDLMDDITEKDWNELWNAIVQHR